MGGLSSSSFYRVSVQLLLCFVISITTTNSLAHGQSRLRKAIDAGVDENLSARINEIDSYELISRSDAQAVIDALTSIPLETMSDDYASPAYALVRLMETISDPAVPAMPVVLEQGMPLISRLFDERRNAVGTSDRSPLLFLILRVLAQFGTLEGTNKVIDVAKSAFQSENPEWRSVLSLYAENHSHRDRLFRFLSKNIPPGAIGLGLLDAANQVSLDDDDAFHPFDSVDGMHRLRMLLEDPDPEEKSDVLSAAVALAFVTQKERDALIDIALKHHDTNVVLEGAWASGKHGQEEGLKGLQKYCLDYRYAAKACEYLSEVSRVDLIPKETLQGAFKAQGEFANWLAHPSELGEVPDEVVVTDQRKLRWPLEREEKDFFVLRFLLRDKTGLATDQQDAGVVGSMTWCFFTFKMDQRPPEDVYAIHAAWEMEAAELITDREPIGPVALEDVLKQWNGKPLEEPKFVGSYQVSRRLKLGKRQPSVIEAKVGGEQGWAIVDGQKSAWYPAAEQPEGTSGSTVLRIHLGIELLGLDAPTDRGSYLKAPVEIDKSQWLERFEAYLEEAKSAKPKRQVELFNGLISGYYKDYLEYAEEVRGMDRAKVLLETYPKLLGIVKQADDKQRRAMLNYYHFNAAGMYFLDYLEALVGAQRGAEAKEVFEYLGPYFKNDMGEAMYGIAAYKAQLMDVAELSFEKFLENPASAGMDSSYEITLIEPLARIWVSKGKRDAARELLTDRIKKVLANREEMLDESKKVALQELLDQYQNVFLELCPEDSDKLKAMSLEVKPM